MVLPACPTRKSSVIINSRNVQDIMVSIYKTYTNIALLLCLTLLLAQTASAQFTGRSWSQFSVNGEVVGAKAVCDDDDIDNDDDGLIELCYLENLDEIRNNVEGSSYKSNRRSTGSVTGCGGGDDNNKCFGYELVRDLDFNDDASYRNPTNNKDVWTKGAGFPMIASDDFNDFSATLEGNGHKISNLFINNNKGSSFGFIHENYGRIQNLGLSKVNLILNKEDSFNNVASLVGKNSGVIMNSYVQGNLKFYNETVNISSAFVSNNEGTISNSYTNTIVKGIIEGLFVYENHGTISDSYTMGGVSNGVSSFAEDNYNQISNIYQAIDDYPDNPSYALVEINNDPDGRVTNSYWDSTRWRGENEVDSSGGSSENVLGFVTAALREPTTPSAVNTQPYYKWSKANWDFGTPNQYPALKHAKYAPGDTKNIDNLACGKSQQPDCDALLRGQRNNQPRIISPENNAEILIGASDAGTIKTIPVTVSDNDVKDKLTLFLSAKDEKQNLVILETTKTEVMTNDSPEREPDQNLSIRVPQVVMTGMTDLHLVAEDDSDFDNAISKTVLLKVRTVGNMPPTITPIPPNIRLLEGKSTTRNVVIKDADDDEPIVSVVSSNNTTATATITAIGKGNYTLTINALSKGTVTITVTANDGKEEINSIATVEVEKNEKPTVDIVTPPSPTILLDAETNVVISIADANFDLDDSVTLTAVSSTQSVVSVTGDLSDINSNTNRTFTLTGERVGTSRISFTATDINGEQSTVSVLLSAFSSLTTSTTVPTDPVIVPLGVAYSLDTKPFFTQSGSGISYAATGLPNGLTFTDGVISGTPTTASTNTDVELVKVTASDGRGGSAEATFTLLINAEPTVAAVTIGFKAINVNTWRLVTTSTVVDANRIDETKTRYQWFRAGPGDPPNYTGVQSGPEDTYMILNNNTGRAGGTRYKVEVTFVDNIGQSVTKSSAIYMIDNEAPMIKAISQRLENEDGIVNGDGTVNEGGTVSITANVEDLNRDELNYRWRVTSKGENPPRTLTSATSNNGQFSFDVPANWIKDTSADNTTRTLSLKIVASDSSLSDTQTAEVVVTKVNNGPLETAQTIAKIDRNGNVLTLKTGTDTQAIAADPDNPDDNTVSPATTYQWQWCQSSCSSSDSWDDIEDNAAGVTYTILGIISQIPTKKEHRFRIKISYTDGQGYTDNTIFTNNLPKDPSANIKVRAKVFLEGPLQ